MIAEYKIEKTISGRDISRIWLEAAGFFEHTFLPGLCRANQEDLGQERSILWYNENVLKTKIDGREISDGSNSPFDYRKMRYDRFELLVTGCSEGGLPLSTLSIHLGHSYYGEPGFTPETGNELTKLGIEHFQDPYAFFPRVPGVTGIIKAGGKLFVGDRMEGKAMAGYLQGVAGFLTYKEDPRDSNLLIEMHKELVEETGVKEEQVINLELLGLFSDPSVNGDDLDFGLLIHTNVPADYFSRGHWKNHVQKKEKDHNAQIIFSQTQHYLNVQILYHQ